MSDVEKFYYAVSKHFGNNRKWHELSYVEQMAFIHAINNILAVVTAR